jgi:DNA-binding NtrC family response regulator
MGNFKYPGNQDLRELVRFSADSGLIWLDESRMLLLHVAAMSALRKELIDSVGLDHARRILTRMGYQSGLRDAELAKKIRPNQSPIDAFVVGPQLHMLEGSVRVSPIRLEVDVEKNTFFGELIWENSWEAEVHLKEFGHADNPVCWMQIGYASGYTSGYMGRFVLFKEVECAACGTNHCRIVGKPVEEWEDADQYTPYYESDSILNHLLDLRAEVDELRAAIGEQHRVPNLIGSSQGFMRAYDLILRAAATQVSVLLLGETGVGKERFARALHQMSPRKDGPFVAVNCAALPHELVESELFGVEKGAYTGASASRMGRFERANGGTLFLDEIGDLPLAAQAKLLRVLQEGEIERLGEERTRHVDVRVVAATNADLQCAVKEGRFRSDLFYRLNVYPIGIPPLRERAADIPLLAKAMVERFAVVHGKTVAGITDKAMNALKGYSWPGNIREMENMIERGVILAVPGGCIEAEHLFAYVAPPEPSQTTIDDRGTLTETPRHDAAELCRAVFESGLSLDELENMLLRDSVARAKGKLAGAARLLGLTRPQLSYRLRRMQEQGHKAPVEN